MHQKMQTEKPVIKVSPESFVVRRCAVPCRACLSRPDKARRINIFYLSVAPATEWCCQVV